MRRTLAVGGLCWLSALAGRAQQPTDVLAWGWASVRVQPDSSRWALDAAYHYMAYQQLTRTFLQLGTGRVSYTWPRPQLSVALAYAAGPLDEQGTVQLGQFQVGQLRPAWALCPRWQLTLDRVWLTPLVYEGQARNTRYRVRTLVGIMPPVSPRISLVLNTEPFLYRTDSWLREVRSQAGIQWQPAPRLRVQALYWNRWRGYLPRPTTWEHCLLVNATLLVSRVPKPPEKVSKSSR